MTDLPPDPTSNLLGCYQSFPLRADEVPGWVEGVDGSFVLIENATPDQLRGDPSRKGGRRLSQEPAEGVRGRTSRRLHSL